MTARAFKLDLILPAIGMKRFTSQSRTPTTIRAMKTCIRGIACYLSFYAARHVQAGPKDYRWLCLVRKTRCIGCVPPRAELRARQAVRKMCCSMSRTLIKGRGMQAEGDGPANTTVLLRQDNLGLPQDACLFFCIQFRILFAQRAALEPGGITGSKIQNNRQTVHNCT